MIDPPSASKSDPPARDTDDLGECPEAPHKLDMAVAERVSSRRRSAPAWVSTARRSTLFPSTVFHRRVGGTAAGGRPGDQPETGRRRPLSASPPEPTHAHMPHPGEGPTDDQEPLTRLP
jgi:hypothetical protein